MFAPWNEWQMRKQGGRHALAVPPACLPARVCYTNCVAAGVPKAPAIDSRHLQLGPDGIKLTPTQDAWYTHTKTTALAQGSQAFFTAAGASCPATQGGAYTRQGMLAPLSLLALLLAWRRMTSASRSSKILDTCTGTSAREGHQWKTAVSRFLALKCKTIREKQRGRVKDWMSARVQAPMWVSMCMGSVSVRRGENSVWCESWLMKCEGVGEGMEAHSQCLHTASAALALSAGTAQPACKKTRAPARPKHTAAAADILKAHLTLMLLSVLDTCVDALACTAPLVPPTHPLTCDINTPLVMRTIGRGTCMRGCTCIVCSTTQPSTPAGSGCMTAGTGSPPAGGRLGAGPAGGACCTRQWP